MYFNKDQERPIVKYQISNPFVVCVGMNIQIKELVQLKVKQRINCEKFNHFTKCCRSKYQSFNDHYKQSSFNQK